MLTIDFHSHILPAIDDGSRDVKTSIEMLQMSSAQRIAVMAATPHFYAMHDRVEDFLQRRNEARESLQNCLAPGMPEILLGAEVAFFKGISRADKLTALTVENTKLLLLEMPFAPWSDEDIEEVRILAEDPGGEQRVYRYACSCGTVFFCPGKSEENAGAGKAPVDCADKRRKLAGMEEQRKSPAYVSRRAGARAWERLPWSFPQKPKSVGGKGSTEKETWSGCIG